MHGRGHAWQAGGHAWWGACVEGGTYMAGWGACVEGGHAWQAGDVHGGIMHGVGGVCGRKNGNCSGRYASYWNAFLLNIFSNFGAVKFRMHVSSSFSNCNVIHI